MCEALRETELIVIDETDTGVLSETLEPENLIDQTEQGF